MTDEIVRQVVPSEAEADRLARLAAHAEKVAGMTCEEIAQMHYDAELAKSGMIQIESEDHAESPSTVLTEEDLAVVVEEQS